MWTEPVVIIYRDEIDALLEPSTEEAITLQVVVKSLGRTIEDATFVSDPLSYFKMGITKSTMIQW